MALTKEQKQKIIDDLGEKVARQKAVVFVDFTGLKVKDLFNLRKRLKAVESKIKVAKKTLIEIAFKEKGLKIDTKKLPGQLALVFGFKDEISPAKVIFKFSQENKNVKIIGGFFDQKIVGKEEVIELAKLSSREELLGRLVGTISAPISNLVYVLKDNLRGLIYILSKTKPEAKPST